MEFSVELNSKHPVILHQLREQILRGEFRPGDQFPTLDDLEQSFQASRVTVHKALNRLAEEGFVYTRGRRGTYVSDHPPHLWHYAMVFPDRPGTEEWGRFWLALTQEAARIGQVSPRRVTCFYGLRRPKMAQDEYVRLMETVRSRRVAGVIFAFPPSDDLLNALRSEYADVPIAAIDSGLNHLPYNCIALNNFKLIDRGLDHLHACGRRKIALFCVPQLPAVYIDHFQKGIAERGLTTRPYWVQHAHPDSAVTARNAAHLLMQPGQNERPDGLFIMDDNLVEYATAGLIAAGSRVPEDLHVVAHCNFPWPTPSVIPARRLGFDASQVMQSCLDSIDVQVRGERISRVFDVFPVFEDERIAQDVIPRG